MLSIRKIGVIGRTYRHLNRYRQILTVLFKYGFGDLLEMLKIDQYIEVGLQMISRNRGARLEPLTRPQRLRMAFEELGPTYIKLGQVLSARPDLIPMDFIQELSKLQDAVPAFPFEQVCKVIESEFGRKPEDVFDSLEETPQASASIGQVHRAHFKGQDIVLKVQYPGVSDSIDSDLKILKKVVQAMLADARMDLKGLRVDGGAVDNNFLMQFQADILGVPVVRPDLLETTAAGSAFLAGLGAGLWKDPEDGKRYRHHQRSEERRVGKECRSRWSPYH